MQLDYIIHHRQTIHSVLFLSLPFCCCFARQRIWIRLILFPSCRCFRSSKRLLSIFLTDSLFFNGCFYHQFYILCPPLVSFKWMLNEKKPLEYCFRLLQRKNNEINSNYFRFHFQPNELIPSKFVLSQVNVWLIFHDLFLFNPASENVNRFIIRKKNSKYK